MRQSVKIQQTYGRNSVIPYTEKRGSTPNAAKLVREGLTRGDDGHVN